MAPRVLRDVSAVDTATRLLGTEFATPLCVAPTGYHGLAHPDGELATAAGAAAAGALFVLSTRSSRLIEEVGDVVAAAGGTWWFQVYLMRDRELTSGLVRRAAAAGAAALVLTADTPVVGRKRRNSAEVVSDREFLVNLGPLDDMTAADQAADVTFADIGWLSEAAGPGRRLPVVVKGVLRGDDARTCRAHGAAAVIVSNHGGRQLDGALPSAAALPEVAGALHDGGACEVYADGGIRSGEDALAALALGARAVFLGRPALWALACGGADGRPVTDGRPDRRPVPCHGPGRSSVGHRSRRDRRSGRACGPRVGPLMAARPSADLRWKGEIHPAALAGTARIWLPRPPGRCHRTLPTARSGT